MHQTGMPDTAVIFVGGLGTRLSEETNAMPKPLVEIGDRPIIWHIMKIYGHFGVNNFIMCAGYKQQMIKDYFSRLYLYDADIRINTAAGTIFVLKSSDENWNVSVIDTGRDSQTGERLRKVRDFLPDRFYLTYGDGVSDIDLKALYNSHVESGKVATVTAVQPSGRFGALDIIDGTVARFMEKPKGDGNWINGGFLVVEKPALDYLENGNVTLEDGLLAVLANAKELNAYQHSGFWQPMDTLREKEILNKLWSQENCPWRIWCD